ncbi:YciI family protein [Nocardioides sp. MAHUQ-72]|uniref:YciI family protein n=1 Tax=unclassified Nocardioides TaxID=2615069 RepID=UPI003611F0FE
MRSWIYFLHPPRSGFAATMTPEEESVFAEHFAHLQRLLDEGTLVLAGPTLGEENTGIAVFEAPDEESARAVMESDPAIASGTVRGELREMRVSLLRGRA